MEDERIKDGEVVTVSGEIEETFMEEDEKGKYCANKEKHRGDEETFDSKL